MRRQAELTDHPEDGIRHSRNDASSQDQRDTVSNAVLVDLLAKPHQEDTTRGECGETGHHEDREIDPGCELRLDQVLGLEVPEPHEALDETEAHGGVSRPLRDLLLAGGAFLLQFLQLRHDRLEKLEDDRRRDVGHDAQSEDR